jgi:hypothetical protein
VSCAHVREELGGYVLAELDPGEREDVAARANVSRTGSSPGLAIGAS